MRLKSLKLAGFKSFANATTFTFPRGITAIVGPNGCGKSNVIDAIRWVLGETSAKQLRGGAMSDVIFAGTQSRAAKSVASVELTFEHTQDEQTGIRHELNLYHELSVRRQVNKDGRSDYFINGTRCRRRDVVDVFLGTGLGARSYAVIEQGMIGRIVESSPLQLREFIEEAAGVSRYQVRRDETQKKLEKTQENLARLRDIEHELVRQQKMLSKQAASAQQHEQLSLTLADIKQQLAIQQLYQAKHDEQQQQKNLTDSSGTLSELQASYGQLKLKQDKLAARINEEQWLKDEAQAAHYEQQLSYQQAEHKVGELQAQLKQTQAQLSGLGQQREQTSEEIDALKAEKQTQKDKLQTERPKLAALTAKRERHQRDKQPLQDAWHAAQAEQARLQDQMRTLKQQQALNQQSQQRLQLSQQKWQRRESHWQTLWTQLQQSQQGSDPEQTAPSTIERLQQDIAQLTRQHEGVTERLETMQPQARQQYQQLTEQRRALAQDEKRHAQLAGEYDTLHRILHPAPAKQTPPTRTADNNSAALAASETSTPAPPLAVSTLREQIELTQAGQAHAQLLDKWLALWLDSHVLLDKNATSTAQHRSATEHSASSLWSPLAPYLADLLSYQQHPPEHNHQPHASKDKQHAAAHSLWLPADNRAATASTNTQALNVQALNALPEHLQGCVLPVATLIAKPALALWQQCYLYLPPDDNSTPTDTQSVLADILPLLPASALLLTRDGWVISRQGTIHLQQFAGAQRRGDSHFLSQRQTQRARLEDLEAQLTDIETQIETQQRTTTQQQRDYDALQVSLEETRAQAAVLTQETHQKQQALLAEQAASEHVQATAQRLNADKATLTDEWREIEAEQQALNEGQADIEQHMAELLPKLETARSQCERYQTEYNEMNRARQADDESWQALQLIIQQSEIRLEHTDSSLVRAKETHYQLERKVRALTTRLERYQQQLPKLQADLVQAQTVRDQHQQLLSEREAALGALKADYSQQQAALDTQQTALQDAQQTQADHRTALALSEQRLADARRHAEQALSAYQQLSAGKTTDTAAPHASISSLLTDFITHERRLRPDKVSSLQAEQKALEKQLSKIGAVNLAAAAELAEVNERLEPLAQQTEDIAASMRTLTDAIAAIDETTKTLFMETLEAVNTELANLFAKVFGGGHASLTLNTDDMPVGTPKSEQWRAGLTLMAQPKGKRNSRLAVLSGGEKTLTALSLIFAIFKQHPAPFCVLDEVDAPLDDANVARFTSLIHELAGDLQFIFISHNKLAMQIADELKGITMPSAGISTLVSVSLEDAAQYIDS